MFTDDLIRLALEEDVGHGDITSDAIVPASLQGVAKAIAKAPIVVAGLGVAGGVFRIVDPAVLISQRINEGQAVAAGTILLEITGPFRSLLKAERVSLNFLQRMCGIATLTSEYVKKTGGAKTKILDTRKTVPLLRHLDKYAVRMGGGVNHRFGLFDAVLIKDNHLAACKGSVTEVIAKARKALPKRSVIVEITSPQQVEEAIASGAARLLLDNMDDSQVKECLSLNRGRAEIEVSGGVTLERVETLSKLGVDFISVGALTHSVRASDISLEIEPK